jgi:flagellar hook-associated protein 1 FlgK
VDARFTLTDTQSGDPDRLGLPVFADMKAGQVDYTGSVDGRGQKQGFAARIALNDDLVANPERLVLTTAATATGDSARPLELTRRLAEAPTTFSPATGIGGQGRPQTTTLGGFAREIVSFQGNQAQGAASRAEDRAAVARAVEDRVVNQNGVNIDEEMNRLMEMEKVYAANAKLMGLVDQMFDTLFAVKR